MKKKLSVSQKRLLLCLVIVIIFMSAYQFVYTRYENMANDYIAQTEETKQQITQWKAELEQEDSLTQETDEVNKNIDDIITAFPVKLTKEDNLVFIEKMEQSLEIDIPSVTFMDPSLAYTTILPIRNETGLDMIEIPASSDTAAVSGAPSETGNAVTDSISTTESDITSSVDGTSSIDTATPSEGTADASAHNMLCLVCPINITFQITEKKFVKLVEYINTYPERTSIGETSLNYDGSTGELICSMTINRYVLAGSGKEYEEPDIGDISIGTDNLFGTSAEQK